LKRRGHTQIVNPSAQRDRPMSNRDSKNDTGASGY
jgi:hypothetical protein